MVVSATSGLPGQIDRYLIEFIGHPNDCALACPVAFGDVRAPRRIPDSAIGHRHDPGGIGRGAVVAGRSDFRDKGLDPKHAFPFARRSGRGPSDPQQHCNLDHDSRVDRVRDPAGDGHARIDTILTAHPDRLCPVPHRAGNARRIPRDVCLLHGRIARRTRISAHLRTGLERARRVTAGSAGRLPKDELVKLQQRLAALEIVIAARAEG